MKTELGKIQEVTIGYGGYQDAQLGIGFTFCGKGWGIGIGCYRAWGTERSVDTKWTEQERIIALGETFMEIKKWLDDAGVKDVYELKGKPVECTFDGMELKSWRILTEVL